MSAVRTRSPRRIVPLALALVGAVTVLGQASSPPDSAAIEHFLREARVVRTRAIGKGVTGAVRATLSDGKLTHDAQIQAVDESRSEFRTHKGVERDFRDSWSYNVAAYRLAKLLELEMVPVSVERTWNGRPAAFTWWLDDVLMDEEKRLKEKIAPPSTGCWLEQMHLLRMFDALIDNTDRNLGNVLYTNDWRMWLIDHTRAFRRSPVPPGLASLSRLDRRVLERLAALDFATLKKELGRYLIDADLRLLLSRRDALVKHFSSRGAAALYDRRDYSQGCR